VSVRKIRSALKKKGIEAVSIEWVTGIAVPECLTSGYDIEFSQETEDLLFDAGFDELTTHMEFHTLDEVLSFISLLPTVVSNSYNNKKEV